VDRSRDDQAGGRGGPGESVAAVVIRRPVALP
jgi:hypothetical protein